MSQNIRSLDSYTLIGDLGEVVKALLKRGVVIFAVIAAIITTILFFQDNPGWLAVLWMSVGCVTALAIWQAGGVGLPLVPMLAMQHFIAYGLPIITDNEKLALYPLEYQTQAGFQVCVFLVALVAAWRFGMQVFYPRKTTAYALKAFSRDNQASRIRMGITLVLFATGYTVLQSMRLTDFLFDVLPNGTYSLITPVVKATTIAGFFMMSMHVGSAEAKPTLKLFFWVTLIANALIQASGFLLSSATNIVAAVTLGLFWSSGRLPWRFLLVTVSILSFLHLGKFDMRERYWNGNGAEEGFQPSLYQLPGHYLEWIDYSYYNIVGRETKQASFGPDKKKSASMLERVDNMQNLLFAINAVDGQKIPTLGGETYALIPPLLIPRILWPDKPRAHEGQILLNVHFGRQLLSSTFTTYIAWGLLPEAYGNFGAIWGAVALGFMLGFISAWIENLTANKPLLSLEGLLTFALFVEVSVSFEYVASVLVTSLFQSAVIIALACLPFVQRTLVERPETGEEEPA
jgi:hypothetical protein